MASDLLRMDQGLLKKNPALSDQEFSDYWYYKHSQVAIPFFLHSGIKHYEQIHGPITPIDPSATITSTTSDTPLDLSTFHGVCGLPPQAAIDMMTTFNPPWKVAYFNEVIMADEKRFLADYSLSHVVRIPPNSVKGTRRVIIKEGKVVDDIVISDEVWRVWRTYEERGKKEAEEAKTQ